MSTADVRPVKETLAPPTAAPDRQPARARVNHQPSRLGPPPETRTSQPSRLVPRRRRRPILNRADLYPVAQKPRDRPRLQRRGHHHQPQRRQPQLRSPFLQPPQQRQRQVRIQVPLMELIQHHGIHSAELRIPQQPSRQHTFGHKPQPRPRPRSLLKTHLVADGPADLFAQLRRHAPRRQPRRNPPRLQHDHLAGSPNPAAPAAPSSSCPHPARPQSPDSDSAAMTQ